MDDEDSEEDTYADSSRKVENKNESIVCQCMNHRSDARDNKPKKCGKPVYSGSMYCLECKIRCQG